MSGTLINLRFVSQFARAMRPNICKNFQRAVSSTASDTEKLRARLLYQSKKRGILENDLIIGGFATTHLNELSDKELAAYDRIVNSDEHNEWDLYYYFSGGKEPPKDLLNCSVFKKMCTFAYSKKKVGL